MSDALRNRENMLETVKEILTDYQLMFEGLTAENNRLRRILENLAEAMETKTQTQTEECLAIVIREELKIDVSIPFMPKAP